MRRLLLILSCFLVSVVIYAGKVTEQQASQKAQQFLGGKSVVAVESHKALSRSLGDEPAFYIFNAKDNEGFVIVSADDRIEAVLGYSYHGTFSLDNMPDNLRWWLSEYTEQIKSLTDDYQPSEKATTRAAKSAIAPLITTTWDQSTPYNLQCPESGGQKCLTGCVATALAQVMYYYKWPSSCTSLPAYVTSSLKLSVPELPATSFKWNQMKTSYAYGENSGPAAEAVAELLRYCGQANKMNYTPTSSGAYIHEDVMINSFNYSKNMRYILRDNFADDHWESLIYKELAENRPVLYGGSSDPGSDGGGHQFICDGYDGNGKYHMNWGWGGYCDGYYLLSACNPQSQGVPAGGRYNTGQHANIGFKPAVEGEIIIPELQSSIQDYSIQSFTRTSGKSDFENIPLYAWIFAIYNVSPESPFSSEVGWGLYQGESLIQTFSAGSVDFEARNYASVRNELSVSFGKDLKDGKYQFRQIYKDQSTQDWTLCSRYISNSLVVEIAGTSMTVRMIDNGNVKFSVSNVRCSDMPAVGTPVTVTADVTNQGESNYLTACLWIQKEGETTWHNETSRSIRVDQEKTTSVEFQFTPESAGNYNLKITSNVSEDALATAKVKVSTVENVILDGVSYLCMPPYKAAKIISADRVSTPEELTIPSTVKTSDGTKCKVLSIEQGAFAYNGMIKKLILSEGVKTMGQNSFKYCYNMEWLVLPSSLTAIGEYSFSCCNSLKIIISRMNNPFEIDENVFANEKYDSEKQNWILIPPTATLYVPVGSSSVYKKTKGWSEFAKVEEGEPFETVVGDLKYFCSSGSKTATVIRGDYSELKSVEIPATISIDKVKYKVKAIGDNAFSSCWNIKTLSLAEGIESIGNSSFWNIGVSELSLPSTLKSIGDNAFGYIYIKSLVIPEGVESIGNYAFQGSGIEKVELPSTLTSIGDFVFTRCSNLTSVTSYSTDPQNVNMNAFMIEKYDESLQEWINEPLSAILYVPAGSKEKYEQAVGWKEFKNIVEMGETAPITIGKFGKASYCGDKSLDFSFSEEVKAYIATGFDKDEGTIWLTRVKDVPAGVPVLIKGEANKTYDVPVTDSQNSYYTNMFVGNTSGASIEIYETSADGSKVNYYLKDGTFLSVTGNAKIGKNKCYLQLPATFNASVTGASQSVTVGQTGKASFAASVGLDFTNVEGLKAFTATGYDKSTKTIWLTRVMKVQQGEGVLLKGDPGNYEIPSVAAQSHYENMFVGNTSGATIEIPEMSADGSLTNYYLKDGTFLRVTGNAKIGNNKCYLPLPTSMVAGAASTRGSEKSYKFEESEMIKLPILFRSLENDGDGTTGIHVQSSMFNDPSDAYYTLQGQRVVNPGKGLYIKNGKKVIVK